MNKETQKKLIKDFPKSVVKPAPKGKFGDYVPHHIYTQRLVDVFQEDMTSPLLRLEIRTMQLSEPNVNCLSKKLTKQLKRLEM